MKIQKSVNLFIISLMFLSMVGCSFLKPREYVSPNYYVLDYLAATENKGLKQSQPFNKTLEVMDTKMPRTYDRNQLVIKKSYSQISYFNNELWATKLYDAVPNIMVQRLNAYNIFSKVGRDLGEASPDYYLETYIQNIEYVEGDNPQAFLRMEFYLRKTSDQSIVFAQKNERMKPLSDTSVEYIVQSYNEMIMYETDIFAAKCIDFLSGKQIRETKKIATNIIKYYDNYTTQTIDSLYSGTTTTGELFIPVRVPVETQIPFIAAYQDTTSEQIDVQMGYMNELLRLKPGRYDLTIGNDDVFTTPVDVLANMRTVVDSIWGELLVRIIDQNQTKVRMAYNIYRKTSNKDFFSERVGSRISPSDEIGETDYLWLVKPGDYMITLQGASPSSYKDFATVTINEGGSYVMTMVVDPSGSSSVLIGAGLLETGDLMTKIPFHKGALHADISFSSDNKVDEKKPVSSINLSGQFDNKLEYDVWPIHYTTRSLYEIGFNKTTDSDFKVNVDDYSLKNSLVFFPWNKQHKFITNFGLFGRADISSTNFFKDYITYPQVTHFIKINQDGEQIVSSGKKILVTNPPFPLTLKEGTGLTYRWTISPSVLLNLRSGYGWNQKYQDKVYSYIRTDSLNNKIYTENADVISKGFESSIILTATNLFGFFSITSTLDVPIPKLLSIDNMKFNSENLINIKLLRNTSLDVKANISYDKDDKDYVVTDYSAFLRLSLYY